MKILRTHRAAQAEQQLRAGGDWESSGLVFTNELEQFVPYRTVYDSFKRVAASIGLPSTRFHDLRHSYAVAAIRAGDDIKTREPRPCHRSLYPRCVTEQMRTASASRMESYISTVLNL
jgi:Phage integrase family.